MRVLLVNKFYYPRGGDCICLLNQEQLLQEQGHEVRVFAMQYDQNLPYVDHCNFASEVSFQQPGVAAKFKAVQRIFGKGDIQQTFEQVLRGFKPEVVHLHNIHSYLSPVLAQLAKDNGCKVVWTQHDHKLLCPAYLCLDPSGSPCEACTTDQFALVRKRCMKQSLLASVLGYLEARYWNPQKIDCFVDRYIAPSQFLKKKLVAQGFPKDKVVHLPNFAHSPLKSALGSPDDIPYYLFVGRFSKEKGVELLLQATQKLKYRLYLAGDGPLFESLKNQYASDQICFLGHLDRAELSRYMQYAHFVVIPSQCYENHPLSIIESLLLGTPVLGSNMGGIPELIHSGRGRVFEPYRVEDLSLAINDFFTQTFDRLAIASEAQLEFSSASYYQQLIQLYNEI